MRRQLSLPEGLVWRVLKTRPMRLKFRRQHPSGPYVLDFFCIDAQLDGFAHDAGDRPQRDLARDRWFREQGVATLRVPAKAVLTDAGAAIERIVEVARSRLPLHHPAAPGGPPPRDKLEEECG